MLDKKHIQLLKQQLQACPDDYSFRDVLKKYSANIIAQSLKSEKQTILNIIALQEAPDKLALYIKEALEHIK